MLTAEAGMFLNFGQKRALCSNKKEVKVILLVRNIAGAIQKQLLLVFDKNYSQAWSVTIHELNRRITNFCKSHLLRSKVDVRLGNGSFILQA